eukprot:8379724-Pyramimonas_sp.AAC.1
MEMLLTEVAAILRMPTAGIEVQRTWAKENKANPELQEKYANAGKNYAAHRQLTPDWVRKEADQMKSER